MTDLSMPIPDESQWGQFDRHWCAEFAGYSQIFWGNDPHLPPPPWHETDWRHAGGADTFFQRRWPANRKVRTDWDVLHLGDPGVNWCGRSSVRMDGTLPDAADQRRQKLGAYMAGRMRRGGRRFDHERLPGDQS